MDMISCFLREQRPYAKEELKDLFSYNTQEVEQFIKKLKSCNVLKAVKRTKEQGALSDLAGVDFSTEEDILVEEGFPAAGEAADQDKSFYVFAYVGVIVVGNRILKIYPKYLSEKEEPLAEMRQILKVLKRYADSEKQTIHEFFGEEGNDGFNVLTVILFLLNDYYEYGIYRNSEDILEINGEGPVLWEKTIYDITPVIYENRPCYMEFYTKQTADDDRDYLKRLHECVLTECSEQLRDSRLEELFEMASVELSEEKLSEFGDTEYILDRLQTELNNQFDTRKQRLLKTLYAYISQGERLTEDERSISMYGTTAFHMVWEKVCAEVFDSKRDVPLGSLGLSMPLAEEYQARKSLLDVIEKPVWAAEGVEYAAKDTLKPDMIVTGQAAGKDCFILLDAKYYHIQLEKGKPLRGNPGIGDVTKQYLYQLAYGNFLQKHRISLVKNCFCMPSEKEEMVVKGTVRLGMLEALGLERIFIWLLPAQKMYKLYLLKKKMPAADVLFLSGMVEFSEGV